MRREGPRCISQAGQRERKAGFSPTSWSARERKVQSRKGCNYLRCHWPQLNSELFRYQPRVARELAAGIRFHLVTNWRGLCLFFTLHLPENSSSRNQTRSHRFITSKKHPTTSSHLPLSLPIQWPASQMVSSLYLELSSSRPRCRSRASITFTLPTIRRDTDTAISHWNCQMESLTTPDCCIESMRPQIYSRNDLFPVATFKPRHVSVSSTNFTK
jgi:hypothetical protein